MVNSKKKGNRGELELSKVFKERGYFARRGQQFSGIGQADVVTDGFLDFLHIESKRTENFLPYKGYEQAVADSKEGQVPLVCHRKNHGQWMAFLALEDLLDIIEGIKGVKLPEEINLL